MLENLKIAIISPEYPSQDNYNYAFVHARAKQYQKKGIEVRAFILSKKTIEYLFEDVWVAKLRSKSLLEKINEFKPNVLAVHYPTYNIVSFVQKIDLPKVAWLHGQDILWNKHLKAAKNIFDYLKKRLVMVPREFYKVYSVSRFLGQQVDYCVFVSNWLLETAQRYTHKKYSNAVIIPNSVDVELFSYQKPININRGISLQALNNGKYGVEMSIRAFTDLKEAQLDIVGTGRNQNRYEQLIKKTGSNARIIPKSVEHNQVPQLFHEYGFFLSHNRLASQGLAMCEAMACGLPVISTRVGGIPEFVRDGVDGYLVAPNDPIALKNAIFKLISDPNKFYDMSQNARKNMEDKCSFKATIDKEIEILNQAITKHTSNPNYS